jgi:hypothetical protein
MSYPIAFFAYHRFAVVPLSLLTHGRCLHLAGSWQASSSYRRRGKLFVKPSEGRDEKSRVFLESCWFRWTQSINHDDQHGLF